jgi:hypothetical protein
MQGKRIKTVPLENIFKKGPLPPSRQGRQDNIPKKTLLGVLGDLAVQRVSAGYHNLIRLP